jgi:hypothetical protein
MGVVTALKDKIRVLRAKAKAAGDQAQGAANGAKGAAAKAKAKATAKAKAMLTDLGKLGLKVHIIYDKYCNMSASKYACESTNSS